jgi:hypothetical protein
MNFIHNAKSISPAALTLSSLARFSHHACATMLIALCLITTSPVQADSIETKTRIDLQMGLKNYIEGRTTDNVYEHFNVESGKIEALVLKNLHPVIFVNGSKFMMCADYLDANGDDVLIDYIVSLAGSEFRVEQEIPGKRDYLKRLFKRIN